MPFLFTRDNATEVAPPPGLNPIRLDPVSIFAICFAAAVILAVTFGLAVCQYRNRAARLRQEKRGAAFLSVRGLVKQDEASSEKTQSSPDVLVTDKESVLQHHLSSGNVPRPFTPLSSLRVPASLNDANRSSLSLPRFASARSSFRFSLASTSDSTVGGDAVSFASSIPTPNSGPKTGDLGDRKVQQLFDPILPDELLISTIGEKLTIVQSFDDGWCVVSRESPFAVNKPSLFAKPPSDTDNNSGVELGTIPAWCFVKPAKGVQAERPIRVSSLRATVIASNKEAMASSVWSNN